MYPLLFELGPLSIYSYGVLLATAYIVGLRVALDRADRAGLNGQRVMDLGIFVIISALLGAKLMLFVVDFDQFASDPARLWTLLKSGGVFYGGLLLAMPVAWWYIRRHKLPLWTTCDLFAPGIALGHAIGRLGCLMAGLLLRPADRPAMGYHVHQHAGGRQRRHPARDRRCTRPRSTRRSPS